MELSEAHKSVIVLYYIEDLSIDEIAVVLKIPKGTVKSRLYFARERIRDILEVKS